MQEEIQEGTNASRKKYPANPPANTGTWGAKNKSDAEITVKQVTGRLDNPGWIMQIGRLQDRSCRKRSWLACIDRLDSRKMLTAGKLVKSYLLIVVNSKPEFLVAATPFFSF